MEEFKVRARDVDKATAEDPGSIELTQMLNGLAMFCMDGGYSEGNRNEVAVNLAVASTLAGLEATDVLRAFADAALISQDDDDEDPLTRVETVMDYSHRFSWDYMIQPEFYSQYWRHNSTRVPPVRFILVSA